MICLKCGKLHKNKKFCSLSCANSYNGYGRTISVETRLKISNGNKGKGHPHSEETKLIISQKMKEYIKTNNSNWQKWDKSEPCEHIKMILKDMNIFFYRRI